MSEVRHNKNIIFLKWILVCVFVYQQFPTKSYILWLIFFLTFTLYAWSTVHISRRILVRELREYKRPLQLRTYLQRNNKDRFIEVHMTRIIKMLPRRSCWLHVKHINYSCFKQTFQAKKAFLNKIYRYLLVDFTIFSSIQLKTSAFKRQEIQLRHFRLFQQVCHFADITFFGHLELIDLWYKLQ